MSIVLVLISLFLIFLIFQMSRNKDHFGGPVKNIQYIPVQKCLGICDDYYKVCMDQYSHIDADECHDYFKNACVNSCIYNRFHSI